jgi:hypothetical protein
MDRLAVAAVIVAVVAGVAFALRRRRPDAPTQVVHAVPQQLDRADFAHPDAEWLVVVFTSATCHTCADVLSKAGVLASPAVAVVEAEFSAERELHRRYAIDAVPALVLADRDGVVRRSFVGRVSATDLWAAVAEVRQPGSTPSGRGEGCEASAGG